jgi:mannan polymerase II complex MNN10 subunit
MAISVMDNPQDSSLQEDNAPLEDNVKHESIYPIKRKPSRTLLYIRNRANPASASVVVMGVILAALSIHRLFSLYMTHRRWINAPITYMDRTCPSTAYTTLQQEHAAAPAGKICMTTLTDSKSTSMFQRFLRWRNFDGILELTWRNKFDYAAKNGYSLYDGSDYIDTSRPPAWSKIQAVKHLLENKGCDWVMWTDADTVIMNSDVRIEDFLPSDSSKDLLVGSDNGGGYNSGVFLVRNTAWSRSFLDEWWNMRSFVRPPGMSLSGDNHAMKALLRDMPDFDKHVLSPPRCTFNSFAKFLTLSQSMSVMDNLEDQDWYFDERYYHRGDFIAHTPGYDNKAECLRMLLQEAQ